MSNFSYTTFRDNTKRVHSTPVIDKFLKFRPKQEEIDDFEKYLTEFWTLFIDSFEGMKDYMASTAKDAAVKYRNRDNGGLLYFRAVALPQLIMAILETCFRTKITVASSISAYSKLEMCISKAPWIKVLWDSDKHTMIMTYKTLVHSLLMFMYDRSLLNKKEFDSMRKRYAKILEVELTEIDEKLNSL